MAERKIRVREIAIHGNHRTQRAFLENELQEASRCDSFMALHSSLVHTTKRLQSFGIFSSVKTQIKIPSSITSEGGPIVIDLHIDVKEKNVLFSKIESYFGSEGTSLGASAQCNLRNLTGFGEISRVSFGSNNNGSRECLLGIYFPSVLPQLVSVDASIKVYEDNTPIPYASFSKATSSFAFQVNSFDRRHSVEFITALRDELPMSSIQVSKQEEGSKPSIFLPELLPSLPSGISSLPFQFPALNNSGTSFPALYVLSPSLKNSLSYSFTAIDTRNSPTSPSVGQFAALKLEMSHSNSLYGRVEGAFECHNNFPRSPFVLSLCASFGSIFGMNSSVNVSDRYFQGAGLFLRGWHVSGIGSRSQPALRDGDSLGGVFRGNALVALSAPFTFFSDSMKSFAFINVGTLTDQPLIHALSYVRGSAGCGLSYAFGPIRLEATYALPLLASPHDRLKPFQIGFGLSMNGVN